jgi:hypothetical protein
MVYSATEMVDLLRLIGGLLVGSFRSHAAREAEIIFLRQQLLVLKDNKVDVHESADDLRVV